MTISIQLVEVPANEQISNRQATLPAAGGTIGRAYNCTVQLPDFNRQLSRIHAEITPAPSGGYQVMDRSTNGLFLNGRLLGNSRHLPLNDGDILKLGDYQLLVSDMGSLFSNNNGAVAEPSPLEARKEPVFSMDNLNGDDQGWPMEDKEPSREQAAPAFSAANVMADDQFGHDPFDDNLEMQPVATANQASVVDLDYSPSSDGQQQVAESLVKLSQLMEQQQRQQVSPYGHDQLMDSLQRTLDRFLEELSPTHLEEVFGDYASGWGNKDKKYWRLYRKQFNRKQDRKEFHRQFSALFLEELRGKG
ncbi:MAG: FHA domain-containing protein [Halopseudomonas sp.]